MPVLKRWFAGIIAAATLSVLATAASAAYMQEHRGGSLRMVARSAQGTIDPHINYTLQYWQLYFITYDGLVGFKKGEGAEGVRLPRVGRRDERFLGGDGLVRRRWGGDRHGGNQN